MLGCGYSGKSKTCKHLRRAIPPCYLGHYHDKLAVYAGHMGDQWFAARNILRSKLERVSLTPHQEMTLGITSITSVKEGLTCALYYSIRSYTLPEVTAATRFYFHDTYWQTCRNMCLNGVMESNNV